VELGLQRVLRASGHPVCTVALPHRAELDLQVSVEYVVHAVRAAHSRSGRRIAVIGHSQGGVLIPWALRFWPDLAGMVDDAIALSGPQGGTDLGNVLCLAGRCPDVAWQMRTGSAWTTALTAEPLPAAVSFSSIGSRTDQVVFPAPHATRFPGAANVLAQDICPLRPIGHLGMLSDAAVHALVMDAITHPGPVQPERVSRTVCALVDYPGLDAVGRARLLDTGTAIAEAFATLPYTTAEPPLRDYAAN
jgi:triacylglycerol lipase